VGILRLEGLTKIIEKAGVSPGAAAPGTMSNAQCTGDPADGEDDGALIARAELKWVES